MREVGDGVVAEEGGAGDGWRDGGDGVEVVAVEGLGVAEGEAEDGGLVEEGEGFVVDCGAGK